MAAQRSLLAEDWSAFGPDFAALRVRAGVHTGTPDERGGDYFGPEVNRVARLMACGHGGQVLASETTAELVRARLPAGVALRDMGERRLKDLRRPERVFQILAPDLPTDFPPLATLDARPNNLPVQLTGLVGRETEVADLVCQLRADAGPRLVTLTGAGGTGKTRLALQVAADLLDDFEHGVWFVDLAPLTDADLVAPTIARALGVEERPGRDTLATLREWLAGRRLLVVLDNYERLLPAAPLVSDLLAAAQALKVLVTSREALRLRGERVVAVQPLPVPASGSAESVDSLLRYDAVRLFVDRATDADPTFAVTRANALAVVEICARLDGLPLAIQLAAARVRSLTVGDILARLDQRLRLLTRGARDVPERHRTIRAAIEWSHDLLEPPEQVLFRRLAVFAGGARLEAAEEVCDPDGDLGLDAADGLTSLLEKSLVRRAPDADGSSRFRMLETVRELAAEALDAPGEADEVRGRHAAWFAAMAENARDRASRTSDATPWIDRAECAVDNLRSAMDWSLDHPGHEDSAYMVVGAFGRLLTPRGYVAESRDWGVRAVATVDRTGSRSRWAASVVGAWGGYERMAEAIERFGAVGDQAGVAGVYNGWGVAAMERGDLDLAEDCFNRFLVLQAQHTLRPVERSIALGNLGEVAHLKGDLALAEQRYREGLESGHGWR